MIDKTRRNCADAVWAREEFDSPGARTSRILRVLRADTAYALNPDQGTGTGIPKGPRIGSLIGGRSGRSVLAYPHAGHGS